jgi:hypothetical protein
MSHLSPRKTPAIPGDLPDRLPAGGAASVASETGDLPDPLKKALARCALPCCAARPGSVMWRLCRLWPPRTARATIKALPDDGVVRPETLRGPLMPGFSGKTGDVLFPRPFDMAWVWRP